MSDIYGVPRRHIVGEVWFWILMVIIVVAVLGIGGWAFGVFTSGPAGAGGAIKQRNSTLNRVQSQAQFEQLAADYDGYLVKIKIAKTALAAATTDVDKQLAQTNLTGVQQVCVDAAQQFNAESRKYLARVWKSAGLPETLDADACTG